MRVFRKSDGTAAGTIPIASDQFFSEIATFLFSTGFGSDTVADYKKGDEFDLRGTDVGSFAALKALMVETGGGVTIDLGDGDVLAIAGATIKLLSQHKGDFDFG